MILFLTDESPDYGADHLLAGFYGNQVDTADETLVVEWPIKWSMHGHAAGFDCDYDLPRNDFHAVEVEQYLRDGDIGLFVVPTLRGNAPSFVRNWSQRGLLDKVRDRTVCYDAEDHGINTRQHFVDALGYEPVAYFKRELPVGATWATPLPFGYPEERIVPVVTETTRSGYAYNAYIWEWARGGLREQIADTLLSSYQPGFLQAARDAEHRLNVKANHLMNQSCLCAISPSGQGWGTNRHLEIVSDGCAPIIQRPTVEFPNAFHAGTECLLFDSADEAVTHVRTLLGDPAYAIGMAQAAQRNLRANHTTAVRARTVWASVHGE